MPHEPRIPGRRRRALGHFRRKLGLTCLDPTIRKTQGGDREGAMIHTDRGQMPHCAFLTQDVWERPGRNLGQGPRELAFRKHIPVTPPPVHRLLELPGDELGKRTIPPLVVDRSGSSRSLSGGLIKPEMKAAKRFPLSHIPSLRLL